jgi:hypothetical protein
MRNTESYEPKEPVRGELLVQPSLAVTATKPAFPDFLRTIPDPLNKFPVPLSREFVEKPEIDSGFFDVTSRRQRRRSAKFPVFSLLNREFGRGEWFASDWAIRQTVWHVYLHLGEATKSARGAPFTHSRGRGECHSARLTVKIGQNSLFAILACPSANRPTSCGNPLRCTGRT